MPPTKQGAAFTGGFLFCHTCYVVHVINLNIPPAHPLKGSHQLATFGGSLDLYVWINPESC